MGSGACWFGPPPVATVAAATFTVAHTQLRGEPSVATQLHVELVAVEQEVWSGEVEMVSARTTERELGILAHHAPLLGQLAAPGDVRLKINEDETLAYTVNGGFLSVTEAGVTILAESCEPASESTI